MKRVVFVVVAFLLLGPFATMVPASVGEWSGLAVFMTWPDEEYEIGSQVNLTVLVFMDGEPFDPDIVNVTVGNDIFEVKMTRSNLGVYEGSFTIDEDLVPYGEFHWDVVVEYDDGTRSDEASDRGHIYIKGMQFEIDLRVPDPGDHNSIPGQTIELELITIFDGELVDADPRSVYVFIQADIWDIILPPTMSRVSIGHYEGSFDIPDTPMVSQEIGISVIATYTVDGEEFEGFDWQYTIVDFFDIWHHNVDIGPTSAEVEYFILDRDMEPIEGAEIGLTYSYADDTGTVHSEDLSAVTAEDGSATFVLDYAQIGDDVLFVDCDVTVESGLYTEEISDAIALRGRDPKLEEGLDVLFPGNGCAKADTDVNMRMMVLMDGEPFANGEVTVYIVDRHQLYISETLTTDDEGVMSVQFHTPPLKMGYNRHNDLKLLFLAEGTDSLETHVKMLPFSDFGDLSGMMDYLDPGTTLSVPSFKRGEPVEVVLECDDADGDERARVMWMDGPFDEWVHWNELTMDEYFAVTLYGPAIYSGFDLVWSDGAFRGTIVIPAFIPDDIPIFIFSIIYLSEYPEFDARVAILEEVQSPPPDQPPLVALSGPHTDGKRYTDKVQLSGDVTDDIGAIMVEFRIDNGSWMVSELEGTAWTFDVPTEHLEEGEHTLEVRAYDGFQYSAIASTTFAFERSDEEPGFAAMIAVMAIMTVLVTTRLRRKR